MRITNDPEEHSRNILSHSFSPDPIPKTINPLNIFVTGFKNPHPFPDSYYESINAGVFLLTRRQASRGTGIIHLIISVNCVYGVVYGCE